MKIILVNGPPRCGKDTVGGIIVKGRVVGWEARTDKFARIIKERTHALYGLINSDTLCPQPYDYYETCKDRPNTYFLGLSPREAYIEVSEFMKQTHGHDIWGKLLLEDLLRRDQPDVLVITDSGFQPEVEVLIRQWGAENFTLLRLHREGCDFSNDSRNYVTLKGVRTVEIENNDDLSHLAIKVQLALPELRLEL